MMLAKKTTRKFQRQLEIKELADATSSSEDDEMIFIRTQRDENIKIGKVLYGNYQRSALKGQSFGEQAVLAEDE